MGATIEAIKLSYLREGIDISNKIKINLNWFKVDLVA